MLLQVIPRKLRSYKKKKSHLSYCNETILNRIRISSKIKTRNIFMIVRVTLIF